MIGKILTLDEEHPDWIVYWTCYYLFYLESSYLIHTVLSTCTLLENFGLEELMINQDTGEETQTHNSNSNSFSNNKFRSTLQWPDRVDNPGNRLRTRLHDLWINVRDDALFLRETLNKSGLRDKTPISQVKRLIKIEKSLTILEERKVTLQSL